MFNMEKESWSSYTERLKFYFNGHKVTAADKKCSILLSVCGAITFKTLKNLVHPQKLTDKSFKDLVGEASSKLKFRYKLFTACQRSSECIPTFVSRLQSLGQYCAMETRYLVT